MKADPYPSLSPVVAGFNPLWIGDRRHLGCAYLSTYPGSRPARRHRPMVKRLSCEGSASGCRFLIQSENEDEAIQLAQTHMRDEHNKEFSREELRESMETV